jgi:hypothetical protein
MGGWGYWRNMLDVISSLLEDYIYGYMDHAGVQFKLGKVETKLP